MLLYTFGSFGWSFFVSWMPRYLKDAHGIAFNASEQVWKQPLLYGGASCLLGGLVSDWLVRRTGRKRLTRTCSRSVVAWRRQSQFSPSGLWTIRTRLSC